MSFELPRRLRREHGLEPVHVFVAAFPAPHLPNPLITRLSENGSLNGSQQDLPFDLLDQQALLRSYHLLPEAILADSEWLQAFLSV